jgi:hypothetical protein
MEERNKESLLPAKEGAETHNPIMPAILTR